MRLLPKRALAFAAGCRVVRVRHQRRHVVGTPHAQRHRGEHVLEPGTVVGGEQAERAPLARLQRGEPSGAGTRLTLTHLGIAAGSPGETGWSMALDKLQQALAP